jgi:hypothetical protein
MVFSGAVTLVKDGKGEFNSDSVPPVRSPKPG